jgi:hypothetical protein
MGSEEIMSLSKTERDQEFLRKWYAAQGDWTKEFSFEWFSNLPMVKSGMDIFRDELERLEGERDDWRQKFEELAQLRKEKV